TRFDCDWSSDVCSSDLVRDAALAFAPQARELGLDLRVLPGDPAPMQLDPDRLGQIVANLVENALKYATSTVEVSTGLRDRDLARSEERRVGKGGRSQLA